jgi:four helix bundle protein
MAGFKSFEEMEVWQSSIDLCTDIYTITKEELFNKDYGLKDQIRRSAVSISSNIAEGSERESVKSFLYFLFIAKGSCAELKTQLLIARNLTYISVEDFEKINEKANSIGKQLNGFIKYLKTKN